ncbi:MAG: hypothetical protein RLZZ488_2444 [Pseudomonadota bacterium]
MNNCLIHKIAASALVTVLVTAGCSSSTSAPVNAGKDNCKSNLLHRFSEQPRESYKSASLNVASSDSVEGLQLLRGYFDTEWEDANGRQQKRCVMSLLPAVGDGLRVRIMTAGHCLPTFARSEDKLFSVRLQVLHNGGFIPLAVEIPGLQKILLSGDLIQRHLIPLVGSTSQLGLWLPEYASSNCEKWTNVFKKDTPAGYKTACFSRQDFRIIDSLIVEGDAKRVAQYNSAVTDLNRVLGKAASEAPDLLKSGLESLWRAHNLDEMRRRNLRALAFLSNIQYCAENVVTVDPETSEPDTRALCQLSSEVREKFFDFATGPVEYEQLKSIRLDATTSLSILRERYLGCRRTANSIPNEFTACQSGALARSFFDKWIRDGEQSFSALSETEKRGMVFPDYFKIVSADKDNRSLGQVVVQKLDGNNSRNNLSSASFSGGFIFDYDPAVHKFAFEKGDSGTVLNVFSGYPVAVLSTVDGEPTSGGASITPLPEPNEDAPAQPVNSCR